MSTITTTNVSATFERTTPSSRIEHRHSGILIAVSASVVLWAGIGTGIWGLVSVFN